MIARCSILIGALLLSSSAMVTTAAEDDPEVSIYSMGLDEQTDLVWAIKRSRLLAIPSWHEGVEEAPLSPNRAVAAANEYVQTLGVSSATVVRLLMIRIGEDRDNRWIYEVHFSADPYLEWSDPRLHVAVAMDGKVIIPERRPKKSH